MTMYRYPALLQIAPRINRLPYPGRSFWYPLRGNLSAAAGTETNPLAEFFTAPMVSNAGKWATTGRYSFPADNGGASGAVALRAYSDDDQSYLDSVMSLRSRPVGSQVVVCWDYYASANPTVTGYMWSYGTANTDSFFGLTHSAAGAINGTVRAANGSAPFSLNTTLMSGSSLGSMAGTLVSCVAVMTVMAANVVTFNIYIGNGTLSGVYSATNVNVANLGDNGPGLFGSVDPNTYGLTIGARAVGGGVVDTPFGNGATKTAAIANMGGAYLPATVSNIGPDTLSAMLAQRGEFPSTLLN